MSITIREANTDDIELLQQISRQTFSEAFSAMNTAENMRRYLDESFATGKLQQELADKGAMFWVAEAAGRVVAYLKLNHGSSQTELNDPKALEIERIYVLKEWQGKNIGQTLYKKALEIARDLEVNYVWLGVWEDNTNAIQFYQKNGFAAFDKHVFKLGNEEQTDIMMKLELKQRR